MFKFIVSSALCVGLTAGAAMAGGHIHSAKATLMNKEGNVVGMAYLEEGKTGVLIHVKVEGLTPGKHGLHLHGHGVCEAHEGFKTAKGHIGTVKGGHGLLNPEGPEAGDLPNIYVGADGTGEMEAFSTMIGLEKGDYALLDENGSTFIIHEAGDDHKSQPIGGAGGRVACGIIEAK